MYRKAILPGTTACLTILSIISGCAHKTEEQYVKITPVKVYVAGKDSISSTISLTGSIEAQNDAFIYSKISDRLIAINVKPGDRVKTDQIIAIQHNEAALQGIKVSEAALKSAKIQCERAKTDYERMSNLLAKNAITQQQYDQAKSQFDLSSASVDQVQASFEQSQVQYNNAILKAPFDGQVAMIYYDLNQMVPAGQPVIKIVNAKTVKVKLHIPEIDIEKISLGQSVTALFPSISDTIFNGIVYRIDEAVNPASKTLEVEVRLDNRNGILKSGLSGEFIIEIQRRSNTIVLNDMTVMVKTEIITSNKGIQTEKYTNYVYCVKGNKAVRTDVSTGIFSSGLIEITSGISFGDTVIIAGQNTVKDGDTVKILTGSER